MILRYGLNGVEEMTQKDVAEKLQISQSYISRIEKKVIKRLKNIIKIWSSHVTIRMNIKSDKKYEDLTNYLNIKKYESLWYWC